MDIGQMLNQLFMNSGFAHIYWQQMVMLLISFVLMYLGIVKKFEPLLVVPISFGMMLTNLPATGIMYDAVSSARYQLEMAYLSGNQGAINEALHRLANTTFRDSGLLYNFYSLLQAVILPPLIFLGVGAMTDFGPLLARPSGMLMGGAAQIGIFFAFIAAVATGMFSPLEASSIAIIGGADGPTAIFLTMRLAPHLLGAVAVSAYTYMALIPVIQPPIMNLLTTDKERKVKMSQARKVSKAEKIMFPIAVTIVVVFLLPTTAPLVGMLMLGNLFKECGVVERLSKTAENDLINIVTIILALAVGGTTEGTYFLRPETLAVVVLGLVAFIIATFFGMIMGKIMYVLSGGKINPLIGSAGVSAVPIAARMSQVLGQKYDKSNHLLMHAMAPNVAGVVGSAIAAGFLLAVFGG